MSYYADKNTPDGKLTPTSGTAVEQQYEWTPKGKDKPTAVVTARNPHDALWMLEMADIIPRKEWTPSWQDKVKKL